MQKTSSFVHTPSPIEGPDPATLGALRHATAAAVASASAMGSPNPAGQVFAELFSRFSPPYSATLTARSPSDGRRYAFANPLQRSAGVLPSLMAAIDAYEAREAKEGAAKAGGDCDDATEEDNTEVPSVEAATATSHSNIGGAVADDDDDTIPFPPPLSEPAGERQPIGDVCGRILPFVALAASQYYSLFASPLEGENAAETSGGEGVASSSSSPLGFVAAEGCTQRLVELSVLTPSDDPSRTVALSKAQALCIVACSFLCLFPRIAHRGGGAVPCLIAASDDEGGEVGGAAADGAPPSGEEAMVAMGALPTINCEELHSAAPSGVEVAKLDMMLLYFSEMERRYSRGFGFTSSSMSSAVSGGSSAEGRPLFAADHTGPSLFFVRHSLPKGTYFFDTAEAAQTGEDAKQSSSSPASQAEASLPPICHPTSSAPLRPFVLAPLGESIDDQHDVVRVDFANMTIGGGAMSYGCVQEEITFALCPELVASRLMHADMGPREAIVLLGAEQFALLEEGTYGGSMACGGPAPHPDEMLVASCASTIVAVDALDYRGGGRRGSGRVTQYTLRSITREMVKLAAGLSVPNLADYSRRLVEHKRALLGEGLMGLPPTLATKASSSAAEDSDSALCTLAGDKSVVATGNWGCGVFLGDVEAKSLLQWIVCCELAKTMHYYPFDSARMSLLGDSLAPQLCAKGTTTRELYEFLGSLRKRGSQCHREGKPFSVFALLAEHFGLTLPSVGSDEEAAASSDTETEGDE